MQEYNNTDRQIHWLSQVLAKTNRAYVPEQKDDSHTNLYFDTLQQRILGRWIEGPGGRIILALHLQSLSFQWLDEKQNILQEVSVLNKPMDQLEKNVSDYPASLSMRTDAFSQPMHFEIPDYEIIKLNREDISKEGLQRWIYYRDLANVVCQNMLGYLQAEGEIRIWPHHFDTGIYIQVNEDLAIGFGLAMEDAMIGDAYYYMSGYRGESEISYLDLIQLSAGKWETGEQWKGAVLPLRDIPDSSSKDALKMIRLFIREASSWFLKN
jgi:hypothetical protein